jgi:hypothetical protein
MGLKLSVEKLMMIFLCGFPFGSKQPTVRQVKICSESIPSAFVLLLWSRVGKTLFE